MRIPGRKRPASARPGGTLLQAKALVTPLNLHIAGLAILALVNIYLLVTLGVEWQGARSQNAEAVAAQRISLRTAEIAAQPLRGLDVKLLQASEDADTFYKRRLPFAYSQFLTELGALAKHEGVKLARVQYAPAAVMADDAGALTEVKMDASLSGDYRPLVQFVNTLERDKMFFLISGVTLTGQQTGVVNLRLRLTTYLRPPVGSEATERDVVPPSSEGLPVEGAVASPVAPSLPGGPR